jgi:hypothetical protein
MKYHFTIFREKAHELKRRMLQVSFFETTQESKREAADGPPSTRIHISPHAKRHAVGNTVG